MALINSQINTNDPAFLYLNLHPQEQIQYIIRHHPLGFLGNLILILGMALFPLFLVFALNLGFPAFLHNNFSLVVLFVSGFYLFLLTFLFGSFINFYFDIIFITNERIINVSQQGLLSRETSELTIKEVEDVSAETHGFLQSFFNFGMLVVETAGANTSFSPDRPGMKGYFTINDIPDPNRIARIISELSRQTASSGE